MGINIRKHVCELDMGAKAPEAELATTPIDIRQQLHALLNAAVGRELIMTFGADPFTGVRVANMRFRVAGVSMRHGDDDRVAIFSEESRPALITFAQKHVTRIETRAQTQVITFEAVKGYPQEIRFTVNRIPQTAEDMITRITKPPQIKMRKRAMAMA